MKYDIVTILGPTATGKTALAANIAHRLGGEIISADSRQIYRGMDIGTGKDLDEYEIDGEIVPFHLIDIADAGSRYNLFEYQRDFTAVLADLRSRGKLPVLCGGSGLYIEAILDRYKMVEVPVNSALRKKLESKDISQLETILRSYPEHHMHNKTDLDTPQRAIRAIEIAEYYSKHGGRDSSVPPLNPVIIGIAIDRDTRRKRITDRLHARLKEGMIDEVRGLLDSGIKPEDLIYYGLEYRYITLYLTGQMEYPDMVSSLETAIHQFAKRQMTWFRGMERRGFKIHWINGDKKLPERIEEALAIIQG